MVLDFQSPFVESAEFEGTEVDIPEVVVDFFEANVLATQGLSDVDPIAIPPDASVVADETNLVVGWVVDRGQLRRHFPG